MSDERIEDEPEPVKDYEQLAAEECDRPGLEGGINFWDVWKPRDDLAEV